MFSTWYAILDDNVYYIIIGLLILICLLNIDMSLSFHLHVSLILVCNICLSYDVFLILVFFKIVRLLNIDMSHRYC